MRARVAMLFFFSTVCLDLLSAAPRAVRRAGAIDITLPESVLESAEVQQQLRSGLTTVFVVTAEAAGKDSPRAALRADVRYELWDEEYLVRTVDGGGAQVRASAPNAAALLQWWRQIRVTLAVDPARPPRNLRVKVAILPFSAEEERDVQRWLVRSMSSTSPASWADPTSSHRSILDFVIGTGLRPDPIRTWSWSVPVRSE
jgi:hypothetical protein